MAKMGDKIKIGEREFKVSPPDPVAAREESEKMILAGRQNPLVAYKKALVEAEKAGVTFQTWEKQQMLRDATSAVVSQQFVTNEEVVRWSQSADGLAFQLHILVRENHPDMTFEHTKEVLRAFGKEEIRKMMEQMGSDETGEDADKLAADIAEQLQEPEQAA